MAIEARNEERFEPPRIGVKPVLLSALGVLLLLAFAVGALGAIYYSQVSVRRFPAPQEFPEPRVQTGQRAQLRRLQADQTRRLNAYRWVDRQNGLIQIPIERAMQLLAAEGMQAYAPLGPAQALTSPDAGAERLTTPQAAPPPSRTTAQTPQQPQTK